MREARADLTTLLGCQSLPIVRGRAPAARRADAELSTVIQDEGSC